MSLPFLCRMSEAARGGKSSAEDAGRQMRDIPTLVAHSHQTLLTWETSLGQGVAPMSSWAWAVLKGLEGPGACWLPASDSRPWGWGTTVSWVWASMTLLQSSWDTALYSDADVERVCYLPPRVLHPARTSFKSQHLVSRARSELQMDSGIDGIWHCCKTRGRVSRDEILPPLTHCRVN